MITVKNILKGKEDEDNKDFIFGAVITEDPQPPLDKHFDKIDFVKIVRSTPPNEDGDVDVQFIIGYDKQNQLVARIEVIENHNPRDIGKVPVTPEHAIELLLRLGEKYDIINVSGDEFSTPGLNYKGFLADHLGSVAVEMPYFLPWMIEKINDPDYIKNKLKYDTRDPDILNTLLENEDIVYVIGKDDAKKLRAKLPKMAPKKYFDLQQQASVLKEYGGRPDYEEEEIRRGDLHDHVISNILSGSISTFGLYNVMNAIKTAPKNVYTEKRDWSILKVIPKKALTKLATKIQKDSKTVEQFVQTLDLALRILSKHPEILDMEKMSTKLSEFCFRAIKIGELPRNIDFEDIDITNQIYLDGLDGLVRDINKITINLQQRLTRWIETRLPYVTQFQGLDIPLDLSGDFKDFE